ncbi:hypothetical protein LTR95_004887 [Oleoguttula sp. CCFEE 5521]
MASPNTIAITSISADIGSLIPGKRHAPAVLLKAGLAQGLTHVGYKTTSHNALPDGPAAWSLASIDPSGVKREKENVEVNHRVHEALTKTLKPIEADGRPSIQLILGGECCQLPGILTAFSHSLAPARRPGALESMASFVRPDGKPLVDAGNVVFFGLNLDGGGNTREQLSVLFDGGHRVFTSSSIAAAPEERAREALAWLEDRVDVILVHYDVDSIDAGSFPLANVPQFTGVKIDDSLRALTVLLGGAKVGGLMVAEVNPDHDPGLSMTGKLVEGIVDAFKARRKTPE